MHKNIYITNLGSTSDNDTAHIIEELKKGIDQVCAIKSINKERQNYQLSYTNETYEENSITQYNIGFGKMLSFYAKFYIVPPTKEIIYINGEELTFEPKAGDLFVVLGRISNKVETVEKAKTVEFYVGSSSSLKAFNPDSWQPL